MNKVWLVTGHMLNCVFENKQHPPEKLFIMDEKGIYEYEDYFLEHLQ